MSVYTDRKYLLLISPRLRNFKSKKNDLFNFSCPICGDSKKNLTKARGYVYKKGNNYFYICHNCNVSTTFSKFLNQLDADQYKEYIMERFSNGENKFSNFQKPDFSEILTGPKPIDRIRSLETIRAAFDDDFMDMASLPDEHYAKAYIKARQIPENFWNEIFYVKNYKEFLDKNFPNHGKENLPEDARIVLFYTNENKEITNVSGRALENTKLRYVTVKILDQRKVFGLHRMNPAERIYITEGQFDSMFLPNAIASGDSNVDGLGDYIKTHYKCNDIVLVFDNQPRNKDIVRQINASIEKGYTVSLLPYDPNTKDLNEMIKEGSSLEELKKLIDDYSFNGLIAKMKFTEWRKC